MVNNIKYLILSCILLFSLSTQGQVTIGADIKPGEYSLLQVENNNKYPHGGGIQLPRLNTEALAALTDKIKADQNDRDKAIGLMVYEIEAKKVIYWNGNEWIPIPGEIIPNFSASNGLQHRNIPNTDISAVGLGGTLQDHTILPIEDVTLQITQKGAGEFAIKSGTNKILTVKDNKIGVNVESPTALLHIKGHSNADGSTSKIAFRYADGSERGGKVLTVINSDGTLGWEKIPPKVDAKGIEVNTSTKISIGNTEKEITNAQTRISCKKGKWLIMAKASTWTLSRNSSGNPTWNDRDPNDVTGKAEYDYKYTWLKVKNSIGEVLGVSGEVTEKSGFRIGLPILSFYADLPEDTQLSLYVTGKHSSSTLESWPATTPTRLWYFYAIRLDPDQTN